MPDAPRPPTPDRIARRPARRARRAPRRHRAPRRPCSAADAASRSPRTSTPTATAAAPRSALARLLAQRGAATCSIVNPTPWPASFDFLLGDDVARALSAKGVAGAQGDRRARGAGHQRREAPRRRSPTRVRELKHPEARHRPPPAVATSRRATWCVSDTRPAPRVSWCTTSRACSSSRSRPRSPRRLYTRSSPTPGASASATRRRAATPSRRCCSRPAWIRRRCTGASTRRPPRRGSGCSPRRWQTLEVDEAARAHVDLDWRPAPGASRRCAREDLEGIVEHARSIAGTRMALFFRDLGHGKVKVSFRQRRDVT